MTGAVVSVGVGGTTSTWKVLGVLVPRLPVALTVRVTIVPTGALGLTV